MDLALRHHTAGRLPQAEHIYQKILQADPNQPVALQLLGVIASQVGKSGIAVDLITKALAINPDYAEAHNNLGVAFKNLGKLDEAMACCHKALAITPDFAEAHYNLGSVLKDLGRLEEAVASYRKAVVARPNYVEAHCDLGAALLVLRRPEEAVASYRKALAVRPDFAEAHNDLGNVLKDLGRPEEAVASYHKALDIKPDFAEAHSNLGNAFKELGRMDEAVASYHDALAVKPDFAEVHYNLGNAFKEVGKLDEAAASYSKALAIKPDYAEAHRLLAYIKRHSEYDDDIQAMERSYAKPAIGDAQRMHLAFGLGKAFEDLHQHEKAFGFFAEGNSIRRASFSYSIEDQANFFKKLEEVFDSSLFAKHEGAGCDDETPLFILGMPRSGTTLVEQILASHRRVHGAGELGNLKRIVSSYFDKGNGVEFPESIRFADGASFERQGVEYIREIRKYSMDTRFITNKMPANFKYIGLIKLILPNAKVIHCRRDPADTCLSIFKTYFTGKHEYSHDLGELGRYYNAYGELMEHWHGVLPGFIHDVQYEDMVADQAGQTRPLLEYCGLEWDDACLEFHKTNRPVRTASAEQVRRPIYKDSVQLWKRYETQLAPMLEILRQNGSAGVSLRGL